MTGDQWFALANSGLIIVAFAVGFVLAGRAAGKRKP
jgi:hypothetical protein